MAVLIIDLKPRSKVADCRILRTGSKGKLIQIESVFVKLPVVGFKLPAAGFR